MQFSSGLLAGNTCIYVFSYLFSTRANLFLYFQIKCSNVFVEILSFLSYLVSSECGQYLAVDHSLDYDGYLKLFLLFFSLIISFKTIFFSSCLGFIFVLLFALGSIRILLSTLPSL